MCLPMKCLNLEKIAITTIRVDEDVNFKGTHDSMGMEDNILNKAFTNVFILILLKLCQLLIMP